MACPFFFPITKTFDVAFAFPGRLPLSAGFCGECRSGVAAPSEDGPLGAQKINPAQLKDMCNLGYATSCSRLPIDRKADAVRFAISRDMGPKIILHFVLERAHAPVEHGTLEFSAEKRCLSPHPDPCVQRQAECYLGEYIDRRRPAALRSTPVESLQS